MRGLGHEVQRELARVEGSEGGMADVVAAWPQAVGTAVAANAWPARLARDGTLHIAASSSSWAWELTALAPSLLARLADSLAPASPPARLRFAVGQVPERAGETPALAAACAPAADVSREAAQIAAAIEDPEVREVLARAAAAAFGRGSADRRV